MENTEFMIADTNNIIKENLRIDCSCLDYLELVPHLTGQRPSIFENICHSQYQSYLLNSQYHTCFYHLGCIKEFL